MRRLTTHSISNTTARRDEKLVLRPTYWNIHGKTLVYLLKLAFQPKVKKPTYKVKSKSTQVTTTLWSSNLVAILNSYHVVVDMPPHGGWVHTKQSWESPLIRCGIHPATPWLLHMNNLMDWVLYPKSSLIILSGKLLGTLMVHKNPNFMDMHEPCMSSLKLGQNLGKVI